MPAEVLSTVVELTPQQVIVLERLAGRGFRLVAFPLYASSVGVWKGNCAALLHPVTSDGLRVIGEPFYLVEGNPSVRFLRDGKQWFVWKKKQIEATPERQAELNNFAAELSELLLVRV